MVANILSATLAPAPGTKLSSTAPAVDSGACWQHGDDVDVEQSIAAHRLPVSTGVTLCISGITDIVRRTQINKLITAGGGTYVKALERPVRVTHLLCSGEDETDKIRYADKFNRAREADPPIQLVWEEWFWDCLEFGGRFDEARYQARLTRPERRATEAHSPHSANANTNTNSRLPHPRAPPATAYEDDDDGDEFAPVKQRLPDVTLQLWGSLLKARGYEVAGGGVKLSPGKARWMGARGGRRRAARGRQRERPLELRARGVPLSASGARSSTSTTLSCDSGSALYLAKPSSVARARYLTECWLERCLFADYLCAPSTHVSFVPLGMSLPVPGADRITLSFSGLNTSEACWVRRLLKALRITLPPAFSQLTTHLLCPGGTGAKYARARQWGVPIVDMGWLAAMAQHGAVPDVQAFLVLPGDAAGEAELDVPAEGRKRKGKDKEKAEETMQDITNSYDSQDSQPKQEVFFLPPPPPARPSFGNPGPALGFPPPARTPGKRVDGHAFALATHNALALIAHAVPTPTQSSSSSSSARPGPSSGAGASAVRRAATFGAASRVTSSSLALVSSYYGLRRVHRLPDFLTGICVAKFVSEETR
ncbi:hypothetical protein DFH09DRAFT_1439346 [Mycena vulgaris]|nr:hypothetical protein DFH09DRAFT_1439346 [Mycena vulgaris]